MGKKNKKRTNTHKPESRSLGLDQKEKEEEVSEISGDEDKDSGKRVHDDDDSDTEEKPKKKKKQRVPEESTGKKGQKSIRQMKREKHLQRQAEAQLVAKDQLKSECLNYLSQWKHDKQNWKFMKIKQGWLFKNKFSTEKVPDASWPVLLEYFESAQGNIRNMLLSDANKIISQMDEWTESQHKENVENDTENAAENVEITKPEDTVYKRARDIIQCLQ